MLDLRLPPLVCIVQSCRNPIEQPGWMRSFSSFHSITDMQISLLFAVFHFLVVMEGPGTYWYSCPFTWALQNVLARSIPSINRCTVQLVPGALQARGSLRATTIPVSEFASEGLRLSVSPSSAPPSVSASINPCTSLTLQIVLPAGCLTGRSMRLSNQYCLIRYSLEISIVSRSVKQWVWKKLLMSQPKIGNLTL